jgi:IS5 family transposase
MVNANVLIPLSDVERVLFLEVVPQDHFLRRLIAGVDFEQFRPALESAYRGFGRPPLDCLFMLKLELLARHYGLSDREVINGVRFNIAFRLFLGVSLKSPLPHHTLLTYFRQRLGPQRMQQVFDNLVGQARQLGVVKDRLRLKDATHIIANIAVPSTIRLVAQTREQLLDALRPFAPEQVAIEEARAEAVRLSTDDAKDDERLVQRVTHLRAVLAWAENIPGQDVFRQQSDAVREKLLQALELAHKILADRDNPGAGDRVRSVHDADARRGFHGGYFDGYLLDVTVDPDSEMLTAINVLPGNGDEGADAAVLIRQEEQAHGNDVEALSIDGAGYRGAVLRELADPAGLNLEVFTPPTEMPPSKVFGPERFSLTMIDDVPTLTCPAGETTQTRERSSRHDNGWKYCFRKQQCARCTLRAECLSNPQTHKGRTVTKNDYEAEYAAAQAKAKTPAYAKVRREHSAVERKLGELVRHHDLRHARYRGQSRVLYQSLITALVVNLKRLVRLLAVPLQCAAETVRAEVVVRA